MSSYGYHVHKRWVEEKMEEGEKGIFEREGRKMIKVKDERIR